MTRTQPLMSRASGPHSRPPAPRRHRPLPAAPLERYRNPRIRHLLARIAAGTQKIPIRVLPVLRAELAAGRVAPGAARAVAARTLHLRGHGVPVTDPGAATLRDVVRGQPLEAAVDSVLAVLGLEDDAVREAVAGAAGDHSPGG